ncbi:DUF3267 domain-containing protein [Spirosoma areae]
MRPTIEQLHHSGRYVLLESFAIDDMNQFLRRELGMAPQPEQRVRKRSWKTWLVLIGMGLAGAGFGYVVGGSVAGAMKGRGATQLWQAVGAIVTFVLLLPIHEFIHGLGFKRLGATKIGYGWSLKSMMIYAYSQLFPATMREVAFVAAMPFLVITTGLLIGLLVWPAYTLFWVILLLTHTFGCIGDFVLIRYYYKNRHRTIYTYDDMEGERRSYFFVEV